jgi:hypothetical protein
VRRAQEPQFRNVQEKTTPNRGTTRCPGSMPSRSIMLSILAADLFPGGRKVFIVIHFSPATIRDTSELARL